jgi:hypothetical protein
MLGEMSGWGWGLLALQLLGLCSVLLARLPIPGRWSSGVYTGCLVAVGLTTLVAMAHGSGCWMPCGTTFSLMIVGAIFDSPSPPLTAI